MGWSHVLVGRLIRSSGTISGRDPFSWAATAKTAVLDGWLFDVLASTVDGIAGRVALSILALAAIVGFAFALYGLARRAGATPWPSACAALGATLLLNSFAAERPQMVSYLLFVAVVALVGPALEGSNRALVWLIVAFIAWANLHLAFSLGVGVVGLYALGWMMGSRRWRRSIVVVGSAACAGLLNPFGMRAYMVVFEARDTSRIIEEWRHLGFHAVYDLLLIAAIVIAFIALVWTGRWRRPEVTLPLVALTALSYDAVRNGPFLGVLVAVEVAIGLTAAVARMRTGRQLGRRGQLRLRACAHGAILGAVLLAILVTGGIEHVRPADASTYPIHAPAAVPSGCRVLNEDFWGGYLAYHRWPSVTVSQDGRLFEGATALLEQQHVLDAEPGWRAWLDRNRVNCVLAGPDRAIVHRLQAAGWERRASDPSGVLLVRRGTSATTRSPGARR